ncbi:unnamed protein product [Effrenium voratum]|nr:unnamed protein product [Effrenium voratum]
METPRRYVPKPDGPGFGHDPEGVHTSSRVKPRAFRKDCWGSRLPMEPRMAKASSRSRFAAGIAFAALALLVHHLGGTRLFIAPHAGETFGIAQRAAKARSALVICAAEATPGAPPVDVEEEEAAASYFKVKMRKKEYTVEQQMTRKERLTERLRKRKGKFVYRGPKPYDPDRFTTARAEEHRGETGKSCFLPFCPWPNFFGSCES